MAADRIALEAETRLPRKDVPIVVYDAGEGLVPSATDRLTALGYTDVRQLDGGLQAWQKAGYELFQDVNSYAKAFGELVESRRHTPSLAARRSRRADREPKPISRMLDVRRFDEYATMNIPGSVSVPGAELVLRAGRAAPDPETTIIVNCAGRTRSIIGTQSLINAGVAEQGGGAAKRDDRLDSRKAESRAWRGPARRDRHFRGRESQCPRRRLSRRRSASRSGGSDGAGGADPPHALSLRRPRGRRICGRSHRGLPPLSRRAARPGDRHGGTGARGAHSPDGQYGCARRHDRVLARANGLGDLCARRRL